MNDYARRLADILASPRLVAKRPNAEATWPFEFDPPDDIAALHAACDGIQLDDGTRILGRAESGISTQWLRDEKSLAWAADLFVIGERDDLVIVRDIDRQCLRAGGGVLEAPTDGLESLRRISLDIVGYLELRMGLVDPRPAPELLAKKAIADRNAGALAHVLSSAFYPGNEADAALAALTLGDLRARDGDEEGALRAFEQYADMRTRSARRGAEAIERAAAFRAAARAAEAAGATALAEACRTRGNG
ncbi:MAG: hypothetical protein IPM54_41895 [Polyangiaceae bacterium]|nr:hypothetical protein [Polyangiaceae bacterium]